MGISQSITTEVLTGDKEANLELVFEDDIVSFSLNGKEIFRGDWTMNFFELFCKAVGNWKRSD